MIIDIYACNVTNKHRINYIVIHLLSNNNNKVSKEKQKNKQTKNFNIISKLTEISLLLLLLCASRIQ